MNKKKQKTENNEDEKVIQNTDNENIETDQETSSDMLENNDSKNEPNDETKQEDLLNEITLLKEEKIRLLAEMENIRKRFEREKLDSIKYGAVNLARDFLSPLDNIERALSAIPKNDNHVDSIKNLIDGLKMVQKEFINILEKNGIKRIVSLKAKFDPDLHQAMMEIEDAELDEGIVLKEIQAGYTMHERLLRPAMVGVSKRPSSKNDKENRDETDITDNKKT